ASSFTFTYNHLELEIKGLQCGLPGKHNLENSIAAIASILSFIPIEDKIKDALLSFKGVKRRFEVVYKDNNSIVIDDYAHHPTELKSFILSVKTMFPERKITGLFQPHLFSRTNDFKE